MSMTRIAYAWVALAASISGYSFTANAAEAPLTTTIWGTVTKVADGDTITINTQASPATELTTIRVRFIGVDTAETHFQAKDGRIVAQNPWGEDAYQDLLRMTPIGSTVRIESYGKDAYGRTLGRVFNQRGDVNLAQAKSGMAATYFICGSNCDETYMRSLNYRGYRRACWSAKNAGRGIYNSSNPLREMPFEFRAREGETQLKRPVGDWVSKKLYAPEDYARVPHCDRIFFASEADGIRMGFTPISRRARR